MMARPSPDPCCHPGRCPHRAKSPANPAVLTKHACSCVAPSQGGACSHLQRLAIASQLRCHLQQRQQLLTMMGHTAQCSRRSHSGNWCASSWTCLNY